MGAAVAVLVLILLATMAAAIFVFGGSSDNDEPDWETASRKEIEAWSSARRERQLQSQRMMDNYLASRDAGQDEKTYELQTKQVTKETNR